MHLKHNRISHTKNTTTLKKRILISVVILFAVAITTLVSLSLVVGYKATHPEIRDINKLPSDYDLRFENVTFENRKDDITLKGWWIPTEKEMIFDDKKTVIFSHGYGYNRQEMPFNSLLLAKKLTEEGYNVFMFDFRNSGESEASATSIGLNEQKDLLAAIEFVENDKQSNRIALMGWSMGAATSIIAGEKSDTVKAVIADSPFADLHTYSKESFSYWTGLPEYIGAILINTSEIFYPELRTEDVKPYESAEGYQKTSKGLFLIHSKEDKAIPYEQSEKIHDSYKGSKIWIPSKGGHIRSYNYQQTQYENKVLDFLDDYIQESDIVSFKI